MRIFGLDGPSESLESDEYGQRYVEDERELESLVHAVPGVALDEPVLVVGRQVPVGTGVLDLLALDRWANTVVLELKRGRSDVGSASEATILSQPVAYARALSGHEYDDLDGIYREYRDRLAGGEWEVDPPVPPGDSLVEAFESAFGKDLDAAAFNREQRIAVVAEDVTPRTRRNARHLVEQGLPFQCIEVGLFDLAETTVASATVVDYDEERIRPPRRDAPRFPVLNRRIIERAFPRIRDVCAVEGPRADVSDLTKRAPWVRSRRAGHPESVIYRWKIAPQQASRKVTPGNVAVRMDVETGVDAEEPLGILRDNEDRFRERDFDFERGRSTFAIVHDHWEAEPAQFDSAEFLDEVADRFAELVELGHDVLIADADR